MRYLPRLLSVLLPFILLLCVPADITNHVCPVPTGKNCGILLNFCSDPEESARNWATGDYCAWSGVAAVIDGTLSADLSPAMSKISFNNTTLQHCFSENDIVEIAFTTTAVRSGTLRSVNGFSVDCYTEGAQAPIVRFTNHQVAYSSVGIRQTVQLHTYVFNHSLSDVEILCRLAICPYQDSSLVNGNISAAIAIDYIYIGPANCAPSELSVPIGDLFFDFTGDLHDQHRCTKVGCNQIPFDESTANWQSCTADLCLNSGADCMENGRMTANGTLRLTVAGGAISHLSVQTGTEDICGLHYTGNKDDIYAEIRVKAKGFDTDKSGTLYIYPRCSGETKDLQAEAAALSTAFSSSALTSGDYVVLQFTNAAQFNCWQSLSAIDRIDIVFRYDGMETNHSLTFDYIYIGSERQNHVMMDFTADSPSDTAAHWQAASFQDSTHQITGVYARSGCLYGTAILSDSATDCVYLATEDQLRYTVQPGDIIKLRVKLANNTYKGGVLKELCIGMGVGGSGYLPDYEGTILRIPAAQLQVDGLYHEYSVRISDSSPMIGAPLRSFFFGFTGSDGYTVDFEIDYIYAGSEINFSAYTGRSTAAETPTPAEDDVQTTDNSLISFRLFHYNHCVNDNTPAGLPAGLVLESCYPFRSESTETNSKIRQLHSTSYWNRFFEAKDATVLPYLSQDGYPILNLARTHSNLNSVSLGCLFGDENAVGVHLCTSANTPLSFDGETYSYDSTKHGVDYDTTADRFYVRSYPDGGFTPFSYGEEANDWFGFVMEMDFVLTDSNAVLELSCIDDAWVFIDGTLVLDLGGGDACKVGSIHFASGEITAASGDKYQTHNLLQRYQDAGRQAVTEWNGDTFAAKSVHSLKIFFLNRSTKGTQCKLSFNLTPVAATERHQFDDDLFCVEIHNQADLQEKEIPDFFLSIDPTLYLQDQFEQCSGEDCGNTCLFALQKDLAHREVSYQESLNNGWHIAPVSGDGHTIVRTKDSTEEALYFAITQRRIYTTDDRNLRLYFDVLVNEHRNQMGDIVRYGDDSSITAIIELYAPDKEALGTLELIGLDGSLVYSKDIVDSYAYLEIPLTTERSYYYVRVVKAGRTCAITAPVWLEKCISHKPTVVAAVAPTCTADGMTAKIYCSDCHTTIVEANRIPAEYHNYVYGNSGTDHTVTCTKCNTTNQESHRFTDGTCICGIHETAVPVLNEMIRIHHTLNLESSIALIYVVSATQLDEYDGFYLECTIPQFGNNVQTGETTVEIQPVAKENYYYFILEDLTAVRMNDIVQARLCMTKNGISYCSANDSFSIAEYAYGMLNNTAIEDSLKILCADLLRYGAEAQQYKSYRTNAPVDAKMTVAQRAYLSNTDALQFKDTDVLLSDLKNPAITWVGKTLSLDSKVGIKFVFDANGYPIEKLTVRLSYKDYAGNENTVFLSNPTVYNASTGHYAVTCYELSAAELSTVVTAAVCDGEKQVSESLQYCAEIYAAKTAGTTLEPLCKALFAYSDSAKAYFAK